MTRRRRSRRSALRGGDGAARSSVHCQAASRRDAPRRRSAAQLGGMHLAVRPGNVVERVAQWLNLGPVPLAHAFLGMMGARAVMAGAKLGVYAALTRKEHGARKLAERL